MATYNRCHLIEESLNFISDQSFRKWECLIIDDGSIDNTAITVERFASLDSRFKYIKRTKNYKKGLPGCRNFGLDVARGKYIVFFDDDDIPHPRLLEKSFKKLKSNEYDFCRYLRKTFRGKFQMEFKSLDNCKSKVIDINNLEAVIKNDLPFNSCQVVWKKSSIGDQRFEESLMYAEEWEFYTRLLSRGLKGVSIDHVLYFGRKHPNSNTGEFYRKDKIRLLSKIEAAELVIQNLALKKMFTTNLKYYFIQLGFQLNSKKIIDLSLKATNSNFIEKLKYKLGFYIYPVLRPLFIIKRRLKSN